MTPIATSLSFRFTRSATVLIGCCIAYALTVGAPEAHATPLGLNLIVNPGAEANVGAPCFCANVAPTGWTTSNGFSAVQYSAGGPTDLNTADATAVGGALNYFAGGIITNNAPATASQTITFADLAASVDAGALTFVLSAYVGGYDAQRDNMTVAARFLNSANVLLLTSTIGPVSDVDRSNLSQLLFRSTGALAVPVGARSVEILMAATRVDGFYDDGYADNLSFQLDSQNPGPGDPAPVPEPATAALLGLGLAGLASRRHLRRR